MGYGSPNGNPADDFARLCKSINKTVSDITRRVGPNIAGAGGSIGRSIGEAIANTIAAREANANATRAQTQAQGQAPNASTINVPVPELRYKSPTKLTVGGTIMTALGGLGVFSFGISGLSAAALPFAIGSTGPVLTVFLYSFVMLLAFTGLSTWLMVAGINRLLLASRFKSIKLLLGSREVCTFSDIEAQTHRTRKQVISDVRKMIKHGLIPEGRIDDEQTCLMTTDNAYRQYLEAKRNYQQRLEEDKRLELEQRQQQAAQGKLPPEAVSFINEGNDYIKRMQQLDDDIDDPAVSERIVCIEDVVGRIVSRVEEDPSVLGILDKLMNFYLPTTVKLLEAYANLEDQPVQGENIASSRQEIEQTLQTLHSAYEKLLDETFRDLSIDVSADISVLNAVLAQEGLTESPFDMTPERNEDDNR